MGACISYRRSDECMKRTAGINLHGRGHVLEKDANCTQKSTSSYVNCASGSQEISQI
jgi:hypothetical protein